MRLSLETGAPPDGGHGIVAPILVHVCDGGYGENVMKAGCCPTESLARSRTHSLSSPTGET